MDFTNITTLLFLLAICIGVIFVIREIILWYYRINERVELQKQTLQVLLELKEMLKPLAEGSSPINSLNNPETIYRSESDAKDKT